MSGAATIWLEFQANENAEIGWEEYKTRLIKRFSNRDQERLELSRLGKISYNG
jgi:hypothetical protein